MVCFYGGFQMKTSEKNRSVQKGRTLDFVKMKQRCFTCRFIKQRITSQYSEVNIFTNARPF